MEDRYVNRSFKQCETPSLKSDTEKNTEESSTKRLGNKALALELGLQAEEELLWTRDILGRRNGVSKGQEV